MHLKNYKMTTITVMYNKNLNQLRLDSILSSQSELGPKIPDGGYGWIIVIACSFFQILVPSLTVGFGTIVLFLQLENGIASNPKLWDMNITYAPFFFITIWTLTEPWCRKVVLDSSWPRLVCIAGTCLTSAGLLILWFAINNRKSILLFSVAGSLSGIGVSLLQTQIDVILSQYFCTKLQRVKVLMNTFAGIGYIITPIVLGHAIKKMGILQSITWYQAFILQGIVISLVFKKPEYLKQHKRRYNLLKGIADEEEDIFTKSTELQSPRLSLQNHLKADSTAASSAPSRNEPQSLHEELQQAGWEKFNEELDKKQDDKHNKLNVAFAVQSNNANYTISHFEDNYFDIPQPLFTESPSNNNVSYSYESTPSEVNNGVVFMPIEESSLTPIWKANLHCFKEPTFYKALVLFLTLKYTVFLFWTLFPSHLYTQIDHLKINHITVVVGSVSTVGIVFSILATWIQINTKLCNILVSIFCWISAVGCLIFSDSKREASAVFAVTLLILNIHALQILGIPHLKFNLPGDVKDSAQFFISTLTAVSLLALIGLDIRYQNCFRLLAIVHFLVGSIYFTNIIYKKIRRHINCG